MTDDRRIGIGDLAEFRFPSRPVVSADGTRLAFVVRRADLDKNRYRSAIWLWEPRGRAARPLTSGEGDTEPVWLDDGRLLFRSERDVDAPKGSGGGPGADSRHTHFYVISPDGGEAEPWFTVERPVTWVRQIDDSRFLVLTRWDPTSDEERSEHESRVHAFNQIPIWGNGVGFLHDGRVRLGIVDSSGGTLIDLTPPTMYCHAADLAPDRSTAVVVASVYDRVYDPVNRMLGCTLADGALYDLSDRTGLPAGYHSVPAYADARTLFFGFADPAEHGLNSSPQIYRVDPRPPGEVDAGTALARKLTDEPRVRFGVNTIGSDARLGTPSAVPAVAAGGEFYTVGTTGTDSALYRLSREGELSRLTPAAGSVDAFDVAVGSTASTNEADDLVVYVAMRDGRLPEVFRRVGDEERRITTLNDTYHEGHDGASLRHMAVESHGDVLDAWVMLPPEVEAGQSAAAGRTDTDASAAAARPARAGAATIPAIIDIHGGPRTAYGTVFFHEMQVWAAAGFAVIFANPHGSDGRGDAFADIRGRYGSVDYDDLMAVVDAALERYPIVDRDRLCVTGGSYGGFMTNWIIGHTDRFAAAASQRSISNWVAFWGTSDIGYYFADDQTGTTPWSDPQELWRRSPIAYADRARTPTLFVHSDADHRCRIQDAIQMHTALLYHGTESRLVWIEGENHELSRGGKPGPRIRRLEELTAWFGRLTDTDVGLGPESRRTTS